MSGAPLVWPYSLVLLPLVSLHSSPARQHRHPLTGLGRAMRPAEPAYTALWFCFVISLAPRKPFGLAPSAMLASGPQITFAWPMALCSLVIWKFLRSHPSTPHCPVNDLCLGGNCLFGGSRCWLLKECLDGVGQTPPVCCAHQHFVFSLNSCWFQAWRRAPWLGSSTPGLKSSWRRPVQQCLSSSRLPCPEWVCALSQSVRGHFDRWTPEVDFPGLDEASHLDLDLAARHSGRLVLHWASEAGWPCLS